MPQKPLLSGLIWKLALGLALLFLLVVVIYTGISLIATLNTGVRV
jgi:hypothetical protein